MKDEQSLDLNKERELQKQIAGLAMEADPQVDLWPNIKHQIEQPAVKYGAPKWMPWAIAASLIVSLGSVALSWQNLEQAKMLYSQQQDQNDNRATDEKTQVEIIENSYRVAKVSLMKNIVSSNSSIDAQLMAEIKNKLFDIDAAALLLKEAIRNQPRGSQLPLLLKATYEQELEILTQISKLDKSIRLI